MTFRFLRLATVALKNDQKIPFTIGNRLASPVRMLFYDTIPIRPNLRVFKSLVRAGNEPWANLSLSQNFEIKNLHR